MGDGGEGWGMREAGGGCGEEWGERPSERHCYRTFPLSPPSSHLPTPRPLLAFRNVMKVEQFPLLLGVLVGLMGLTILLDAWQAGGVAPFRERRRRARAVPNKGGQTLIALGTLCMAAALLGRDTWRWGTISVLAGAVLLVMGAIMNRSYLKEVLRFRRAASRGQGGNHTR